MKKIVATIALALAAVALAADMKLGTTSDYAQPAAGRDTAGKVYPVQVDDAGVAFVRPGSGHWDCAPTAAGTCTSTGSSNHGNLTVTAGSYVKGYCTSAAYIGGPTTRLADGGNLASCASTDGGTIPHDGCPPKAANEMFYLDLRGTTLDSIGCTSVSGTANCPMSTCQN